MGTEATVTKDTPKLLSPSGKARLLRDQTLLIAYLTARLTTCDLNDFKRIQEQLFEAQKDFTTLAEHPTKPKRMVSRGSK